MAKKSPLAPSRFPALPPIDGVRLSAGSCGLRYKGRSDVMVAELAKNTRVAGVFTQSLTAAAPIDWCRRALRGGRVRAIVVNSGNANAFTGRVGDAAVRDTVRAAAALFKCPQNQIFVSSTGVIGEPLPVGRLVKALPRLQKGLDDRAWRAAADAIMTTDTFAKGATRTATIDGVGVTINGIAKGSGMIAPDMATMLAYVFTDAAIDNGPLQTILAAATNKSFNAITVDSDTSTSDTVLLCATGRARHKRVTSVSDSRLRDFRNKLEEVMIDLAQQLVRDGEGASKFITVTVTGAASSRAARRIALAIANSPLVKTAVAGEDANWGRIVMAVGKAGEKANRDRLEIKIGGIVVAEDGLRRPGYDETPVARHMKGQNIDIAADVGIGRGAATVWTCDLTHGYIDINADYRT
jgi:glutamate N-acetyltransferase/amino-acid N-acetyltransferase